MAALVAGQSWIYRPPQGFEASRLIVGSIVTFKDDVNIACCSVVDAPRHAGAKAADAATVPFLPMTETAFRASIVQARRDGKLTSGVRKQTQSMDRRYARGRGVHRLYAGNLEQMIDLEFSSRQRAPSDSPVERLISEVGKLLASGLETKVEPFPNTQVEFEEILRETGN